MRDMKRFLGMVLLAGSLCAAAVSCAGVDEPQGPQGSQTAKTAGNEVTVFLPLRTDGMFSLDGTELPLTRSSQDMTAADENAIDNVWVFLFGEPTEPGNDDSRELVCPPYYLDNDAVQAAWDEWDDDGRPTTYPQVAVPLIESPDGEVHMVVLAANVNSKDFSWNMSSVVGEKNTYADLKTGMMLLASEGLSHGGDSHNLLMSGRVYSAVKPEVVLGNEVDEGGVEGTAMTRSLARIEFNLSVAAATAKADLKVLSVQVRNVSNRIDIFDVLKARDNDPYAFYGAGETAPYTDIYPALPTVVDYDKIEDRTNGLVAPGAPAEKFVWYVPRNTRGQSLSPSPRTKNSFAPIGATYIEVVVLNTVNDEGLIYRIYPGANDTDDYTLIPNWKYKVDLHLDGDGGEALNDSRVEQHNRVRFDGNNNSFILNPPVDDLFGPRTFEIPVTQVNRYWRPTWVGYGGLGKDILNPEDEWQVDLLWQDVAGIVRADGADEDTFVIIKKSAGQGGADHFTLTVPRAAVHGNFVITLRKKEAGSVVDEILWSWHFWVTDYNPDECRDFVVHGDKFVYPLTGKGQVERYGGTRWGYAGTAGDNWDNYNYTVTEPTTDAPYAQSFIMDRPLGYPSDEFLATGSDRCSYGVYFQFGRKDPLSGYDQSRLKLCNIDGIALTATAPAGFSAQKWTNYANPVSSGNNTKIQQTVNNPTTFYTAGNAQWVGFENINYLWLDSQIPKTMGGTAKSIYDPCPPGWHLPITGTWDDFRHNVTANNATRDLSFATGIYYWPYRNVEGSYPVEGRIFYHAIGDRRNITGIGQAAYRTGGYWSAVPQGNLYSYLLNLTSSYIYPNNYIAPAHSESVRCISM